MIVALLVKIVNTPRWLLVAVVTNWVVCSWTYALIEHKGPIESLWWGIVTGSTVGYGDFYPKSTAGRGIGAWLILTSIIAVAMGTAQLAARLVADPNVFTHDEQEDMKSEVRAIRADIAALTEMVTRVVAIYQPKDAVTEEKNAQSHR